LKGNKRIDADILESVKTMNFIRNNFTLLKVSVFSKNIIKLFFRGIVEQLSLYKEINSKLEKKNFKKIFSENGIETRCL